MAGNIQPIPPGGRMGVHPTFYSKVYQFAEAITQIAMRVLFISASILMAAAAFPISWHAVVIPLVAAGTTILSGFFYPHPFTRAPLFGSLPPLIRPFRAQENGEFPAHYPLDAPRGFVNRGTQNCAFNSIAQLLDGEPQLAHWILHPLTDDIDLPAFQNFLAEYNPPAPLVEAFNAYVEGEPAPLPPLPTMFSTFLTTYIPPVADLNAFNAIRETYRNVRLLQAPFNQFYQAKDQAIQERQAISGGNAQNLRMALNRVTASISVNPHHQMDAADVISPLLETLPDHLKMKIEMTYQYNLAGLPPMLEPRQPKEEKISFFTLPIRGPNQGTLQGLFHDYCNSTDFEPHKYEGTDGQRHDYPVDLGKVELLEPPPALRFQIMRFRVERAPVSWLSRWFPRIFPSLGINQVKLDPPIECPDEFPVTLKDGRICRYRLSSFVNHHGISCGGGHYTAGRIVNGRKYLINDEHVTLVGPEQQELWNDRLRHAYLLSYLPVNEPAPVV